MIDITIETTGLSTAEHGKRVRWAYRNMMGTNADMEGVFYLAAVRDENGDLLEFTGAGRGKPSDEIQTLLEELLEEQRS